MKSDTCKVFSWLQTNKKICHFWRYTACILSNLNSSHLLHVFSSAVGKHVLGCHGNCIIIHRYLCYNESQKYGLQPSNLPTSWQHTSLRWVFWHGHVNTNLVQGRHVSVHLWRKVLSDIHWLLKICNIDFIVLIYVCKFTGTCFVLFFIFGWNIKVILKCICLMILLFVC